MTSPNEDRERSGALAIGGQILESSVSLCLRAYDIDIEAITTAIKCVPTEAHKRGATEGRRHPATIGVWLLQAPKSLLLADAIQYLLESTTGDVRAWSALLPNHSISVRIGVFLHSYDEATDIPAKLLSEMGQRRWAIKLDLYSAGGEEIIDGFLSKKHG